MPQVRVHHTRHAERVAINTPVEYRFAYKTCGEIRPELKVAPALTLTIHPSLLIIPAGDANRTREISVEITHNARRATNGAVKLVAPSVARRAAGDRTRTRPNPSHLSIRYAVVSSQADPPTHRDSKIA